MGRRGVGRGEIPQGTEAERKRRLRGPSGRLVPATKAQQRAQAGLHPAQWQPQGRPARRPPDPPQGPQRQPAAERGGARALQPEPPPVVPVPPVGRIVQAQRAAPGTVGPAACVPASKAAR